MQAIVTLLPDEFHERVVDARARLAEDAVIGDIYDPPFAHFSLQLALEYDWAGLESALSQFAAQHPPFDVRTSGLLCFTGNDAGIGIAVYRDEALVRFHADLWEAVSPHATENIVPFYQPDRWVPHVTIKRCGPDSERFGTAMAKLAKEDFFWTMRVDTVAVQHDPGKNSLTHYLRLRFPLGG